jgi:hypothetical protein
MQYERLAGRGATTLGAQQQRLGKPRAGSPLWFAVLTPLYLWERICESDWRDCDGWLLDSGLVDGSLAMQRFHQALLIGSVLGLSWLLMQAVHESGHVAAAWITGGKVTKVVLHPLAISRTDVEPNPQPLIVAWGGPVVGITAPFAMWGIAATTRASITFLARFFAGFCLLANGIYLGVGSIGGIGDAGDILRHGSPIWMLWLFGLATAPTGLWLWSDARHDFGLMPGARSIAPRIVYGCAIALLALTLLELLLFQP